MVKIIDKIILIKIEVAIGKQNVKLSFFIIISAFDKKLKKFGNKFINLENRNVIKPMIINIIPIVSKYLKLKSIFCIFLFIFSNI